MSRALDPLGNLEVTRVLAFSRAREEYPGVPRGMLLDYCQAAWQLALSDEQGSQDILKRFDRALSLVAWTHRRSSQPVHVSDLVDQLIPRVALAPFMRSSEPKPAAVERTAPEAPPAAPAERATAPPQRRRLPRVPFASPVPVGAALAVGAVGVAAVGQTDLVQVPQLAPTGNETSSDSEARAPAAQQAPAPPAAAALPSADRLFEGGSEGARGFRAALRDAADSVSSFASSLRRQDSGVAAPRPAAFAAPAPAPMAPAPAPAPAPAAPLAEAPVAPPVADEDEKLASVPKAVVEEAPRVEAAPPREPEADPEQGHPHGGPPGLAENEPSLEPVEETVNENDGSGPPEGAGAPPASADLVPVAETPAPVEKPKSPPAAQGPPAVPPSPANPAPPAPPEQP